MNDLEKAKEALKASGYELHRHGAKHDVYFNRKLGRMITLKRHDFDKSDLRYIEKEITANRKLGE